MNGTWRIRTVNPMNAVDTVSTATMEALSLCCPYDTSASQKPQREHVFRLGIDAGPYTDPGYLGSLVAVPGQLCPDKFVIRHVLIQGMDYPVPPKMDSGLSVQPLIYVRVSQYVQPVTAVSNAVLSLASNLSTSLCKRRRVVIEKPCPVPPVWAESRSNPCEAREQPAYPPDQPLEPFLLQVSRYECVYRVGRLGPREPRDALRL
jgi:hypothetical protein